MALAAHYRPIVPTNGPKGSTVSDRDRLSAQARRSLLHVLLAATAIGVLFVATSLSDPLPAPDGTWLPYVSLYDEPSNRLEANLNQGDGQAYAALARDPLLLRPEVFREGVEEAAYRNQRPLFGWLGWATSLGQPSLVPYDLLLWSLVGFVSVAVAVGFGLARRGANPVWSLIVALSPGALVTLDWMGPDALTAAMAVAGAMAWLDDRPALATTLLVAAALLRETSLLVVGALVLHELWVRRDRLRKIPPLIVPAAAYLGWVGVVYLRLGALPSDAGGGRIGAPVAGLADAMGGWAPRDYLSAALLLGLGVVALVLGRRDPMGWIAGAFIVASLLLGEEV